MNLSAKAKEIYTQISGDAVKMGDLKRLGKEIKRDHDLAMQLWSTEEFHPRMLAVLIMDKKQLTQDVIDELAKDVQLHEADQRNRLADWLLANQLTKDKKTIALMETWENHPAPMLRRLFWYYQARLRWTGKTPPNNTPELMLSIKANMETAEPEVQWAMNFTAAQIGIHESEYRATCIELGEKLGLYKDEPVPRGCTPNYLPEFIRIETEKLNK